MRRTQPFIFTLFVVMLFCSVFILTSCGQKNHTHNFSTEWIKNGTYHWQACSGCDEIRNKAEHDWNSGVVTLNPTEVSEGAKTFTCNTCGQTRIESIPALETHQHTFTELWSFDELYHWHAATCEHTTERTDYDEHDWDDGVVTLEPTTTSTGTKTFTCKTCSKTKTQDIPKLEEVHSHTYNQQNTDDKYLSSAATCIAKAKYFYSCSCGAQGTETFEHGDFAKHKFTTYVSNDNATCIQDGTKTATCDVCKIATDVITDIGTATGHSYSNEWTSDDAYHWHVATCEHTGEISDKETHRWNDGVITKQPTETTEGEKKYTCDVCGRTKVGTIGKIDHVHTFATEYTSDDNYHWYAATCTHTNEVNDKTVHRWNDGVITSKATVYDEGVKLFTCRDCGHEKEEAIAKIASFTVVFYDSGSRVFSKENYELNTPSNQIVIPAIQAEDGFRFEKWVNIFDSKNITDIDFSKTQENTVYQFKPAFIKTHNVIFVDYEGNQLGETIIVDDGKTLKTLGVSELKDLPSIPEREGYTATWNEQILFAQINEAKIFVPVYEILTFEVSFLDAKSGNEIGETQTVEYGSFALIPEYELYRFGKDKLYAFTGWKNSTTDEFVKHKNADKIVDGNNIIDGNKIIKVYSDLTVYAVYEESIEQPVLAIHIDGTTVKMSLCMPDGASIYSINLSMSWSTEMGISEISSVTIANLTYLDGQYCSRQEGAVHMEQSTWFAYNNKTHTFDFVWGCGNGHNFSVDLNTITINFGVQGFAEITEDSFSVLDGSSIVYGENGASISSLKKSDITIWFY